MDKYVLEYVWLDGDSTLRSKTRVLNILEEDITINNVPKWNYDGSSTKQAFGSNSEIILFAFMFCATPPLIITLFIPV